MPTLQRFPSKPAEDDCYQSRSGVFPSSVSCSLLVLERTLLNDEGFERLAHEGFCRISCSVNLTTASKNGARISSHPCTRTGTSLYQASVLRMVPCFCPVSTRHT